MLNSGVVFPLDQWYVAGFAWEFQDQPIARTLLSQPVVLFRHEGQMAALEDRCCHRALPLSCGALEERGLRCGYHGLLFSRDGKCIEIPGQAIIANTARVRSYRVEERNQIVWIWMGATEMSQPPGSAPAHEWHDHPQYDFKGDVYHYKAPYQLIHDNLLDLSHLGYVHAKTIGGNAAIHVKAEMSVTEARDSVKVVRHMRQSQPPPTYAVAWPFHGTIDRWQEIEFHVSHFLIWTGAMDSGSGDLNDPNRAGFHLRGFHGITPETETTSHYFWSISSNRNPERPGMIDKVIADTAFTFDEDRAVIEAQFANLQRFPHAAMTAISVDNAPNRARRIVARLTGSTATA